MPAAAAPPVAIAAIAIHFRFPPLLPTEEDVFVAASEMYCEQIVPALASPFTAVMRT